MRKFRLQQLVELHHPRPKFSNYSWWNSAPPPIPVQETVAGCELVFCPRSPGMTTTEKHMLNVLRDIHKHDMEREIDNYNRLGKLAVIHSSDMRFFTR